MAINRNGISRAAEVLQAIQKRTFGEMCSTATAERRRQKELRLLDIRFSYLSDIDAIYAGHRASWTGLPTQTQQQILGLALWGSVPTCATFIAVTPPEEAPDYISQSARGTSAYWYRLDGLIRQSDHWGQCANSHWGIDDSARDCGWCSWESFKTHNQQQ